MTGSVDVRANGRRVATGVVLVVAIAGAGCRGEAPPDADVAIANATIVDIETGDLLANRTIFVAGNRIVGVRPSDDVRLPAGADVVDASGRYVIPGLWDAHVHSAASTGWHFPLLLAHGVTSVRNMHTTVDTALELTGAIQRQIASGKLLGPRFLANGPIIDGYPPSWPGAVTARTADEGRAAVDSLASAGADFIKVYDNLLPETYAAILDEAQRIGVPVDGHVPFLVRPEDAAAAGQRTVEHTSGITSGCSAAADSLRREFRALLERLPSMGYPEAPVAFFNLVRASNDTRDPDLCTGTVSSYADGGVSVVPTLVIGIPDLATRTTTDSIRMSMLPQAIREQWRQMAAGGFDPIGDVMNGSEWTSPINVELLAAAGVRILAGTDLGNPFFIPGLSLHDELRLLVDEAGLTPLQALQAATINPALTFGMADSLGTLVPGRLADLVLLDENPLEDIGAAQAIYGVMLDGRYLDRGALDELLAQAASE